MRVAAFIGVYTTRRPHRHPKISLFNCTLKGTGNIQGERCVGGFVGEINSGKLHVRNCTSLLNGNISANNNYVGGLIGYSASDNYSYPYFQCDIDECSSFQKGNVEGNRGVGGLIGWLSSIVKDETPFIHNCVSYQRGNIITHEPDKNYGTLSYAGGLVGYMKGYMAINCLSWQKGNIENHNPNLNYKAFSNGSLFGHSATLNTEFLNCVCAQEGTIVGKTNCHFLIGFDSRDDDGINVANCFIHKTKTKIQTEETTLNSEQRHGTDKYMQVFENDLYGSNGPFKQYLLNEKWTKVNDDLPPILTTNTNLNVKQLLTYNG